MNGKPPYNKAAFLLSVASLKQLPPDCGAEIAFIGRSNAGKSSAINTITGIKGLARSSKTPGRTQTINFFGLNLEKRDLEHRDAERRLVDLPGYGYAKAPLPIKLHWQETVDRYLASRRCLKGLVLIMDVRHPLKDLDLQIIQWADHCKVPLHILLTKADKLSFGAANNALRQVEQSLQDYTGVVGVQLFSSLDRIGLEQSWAVLDLWLG
jgi:GTP-binding protein